MATACQSGCGTITTGRARSADTALDAALR